MQKRKGSEFFRRCSLAVGEKRGSSQQILLLHPSPFARE
jgi:hypothetical protein